MPDTRPIVLVNRTSEPLKFTADSQHHILAPGKNYGFFAWQAPFAKAQNPLFGSEDFYSLDYTSLVGVEGEDNCDPIPEEELIAAMDKVERFDREANGMRPGVKVANRHSIKRGRAPSGNAGQNAFAVGTR